MGDDDGDSLLDAIDRVIRLRQELVDARERTRWARDEAERAMKRAGYAPCSDRQLAQRERARSSRVRERADEQVPPGAGESATAEERGRHEHSTITHEMHATVIDEVAAAYEHGDDSHRSHGTG